jgi:hypothetical protein
LRGDCLDALHRRGPFSGIPSADAWDPAPGFAKADDVAVHKALVTHDTAKQVCTVRLIKMPTGTP